MIKDLCTKLLDRKMAELEHKKDEVIDGYIGNVGYSTFATKEKGKIIYERMMKNLEGFIEKYK